MLQRAISSSSSSLVRCTRSGSKMKMVGSLRHHRVSSSSSAFGMNSIISNDDSSSNLLLAKKMWRLNEVRSYDRCIEVFESSESAVGSESVHGVHAAMLAYSEAWQPWRVKELFDSCPSEARNALSLCLLMHSYARADKLGSAERLMLAWTQLRLSRLQEDVVTSRFLKESYMISSIRGGDAAAAAAAGGVELAMLTTTGSGSVNHVMIPLGAWISMMAIYSQRRAWRQCIDIINYLSDFSVANGACYGLLEQSVADGREAVEYSSGVDTQSLQLGLHLDELLVPSFMVTHDDILTDTLDEVGLGFRGGNAAVVSEGQFLQWNMLFHLTLRALSDSHQFNACAQLMARMRRSFVVTLSSNGQHRSSIHRLSPQLPAIASLLQSFTASSADGIAVLTSEGIRHHRELLISLRGSIEDAVAAASSHESCGGGGGRLHRGVRRVVSNLVREYLQALCRLDALDEADQFVSAVRNRATAATTAPSLQGSKWSGQEGQGLSSNEWLSPLLLRLKERGEWEKIEDMGELLMLQGEERERHGGTDNSSQRISMYHHTCEALRRAGQWEKLAEVMNSYSRR